MGSRSPSWASGLPYGAVMATAAAARLAPAAGLPKLAVPLLAVAIVQALLIAGQGWIRPARPGNVPPPARRADAEPSPPVGAADAAPSPPAGRFGLFTIPIGCAVIGANLAAHTVPAALGGAVVAVGLGWLSTAWLVARQVVPVATRAPGTRAVDGTWFLAPAALLADAIGVAAVVPHVPEAHAALGWLAVSACAPGTVGYGVVLALAAVRVRGHGLAGAGRAPWWISAGCAGLAAAALGRVGEVVPVAGAVTDGFRWGVLLLWTISCLLLVPVIAGSLRHLWRLRRPYGRVVWPPTFSTGVFALGAAPAGTLWSLPVVLAVHRIAGTATVTLWMITSLLALVHLARQRTRKVRIPAQASPAQASARASTQPTTPEGDVRDGRQALAASRAARSSRSR